MIDLFLAWIAFPLLLAGVTLGCGRLARAAMPGARIPATLLAPVGFALLIVVGGFLTLADVTAELVIPVAVALAVAGFLVGGLPRLHSEHLWPALAALGVFAVYAAPIVLSGEATFAGYIKLDDTATWMAITDHVMEHGRDLGGLAPSTYEAALDFNVGGGYPVGVFIPFGVASALAFQDLAWTVQPYMAFLAAMLALALYELGRPLLRSAPLRAAAAFLAAQSALLYGYYLWGGIKELAAAALIATAAALAAAAIRERIAPATVASLALVTAALVGVLSAGGIVWLGPALLAVLIGAVRMLGPRLAAIRAGTFLALTGALSIPVLAGGLVPPTSSPLTSSGASGNLLGPLDPRQLAGVWPSGDFRVEPDLSGALTGVLVAAVLVAAVFGIGFAWRRRAFGPLIYVVGALLACGAIAAVGSPWVDGKVLATASPAIPFAAAVAGAALWLAGRRPEGGVVLVVLAAGILWSNALAYRDAWLAPRDQLAELEEIGDAIAGQGPTLLTEYQPYGARHFLREADPESVSELRTRTIPLRTGAEVPRGVSADTDDLSIPDLLEYRTLVVRRSPAQSRPPSPYDLVSAGEYYEVWQRSDEPPPALDRLPLGDRYDPVGRASCRSVLGLAELAGPGGSLVAVRRAAPLVVPLSTGGYPESWLQPENPAAPIPDGSGELSLLVRVPEDDEYELWLGESVRPHVELIVDGRPAGSVRHHLNNFGQYVQLGSAQLDRGSHAITIRFDGADLRPGSGGPGREIGPVLLGRSDSAGTELERVPRDRAGALCGRSFDWIEVDDG